MKKAFTLIELLIVVAIIGILAAIAVPNFINAQIRAKVANTQADQRALATALETYQIDNNMYPPTPNTAGNLRFHRLAKLTTPVAYMSTVPLDPFRQGIDPNGDGMFQAEDSAYPLWDTEVVKTNRANGNFRLVESQASGASFLLHGAGPDTDYEAATGNLIFFYDISNGTISDGDVSRFG